MNSVPEGFKKVCKLSDLKEEIGKQLFVDDVEIAVYKSKGEVFAVSNICPHQHTHLIYDGYLDRGHVVCPVHGWMFNLKTGCLPNGSRGLPVYESMIIDNYVYVKVYKKELNW